MNQRDRLEKLKKSLRIEEKEAEIKRIEEEMLSADFWSKSESSSTASHLKSLKDEVKSFNDIYEIAAIASDEDLKDFEPEIEKLESLTRFSGEYDRNSAVLNFYAGAGGDDAQDWTGMLMRMYIKWAEKEGFTVKIISKSEGAIAGIKNATLEIIGEYTFGKLKGENGVHRLVRQSPFNAKDLRQTSFSLVEVLPLIPFDSTSLTIDDKDLKIDTFRASGHGGQSVNTTDSAVRITHIPTGIIASCQNERSQLQNKESALSILKSRLAKQLLDEHKNRIDDLRGESIEPEWGSQIRSYVLHPYKQVKDHRSGYESKSPDAVLNGEIDGFLEAELP